MRVVHRHPHVGRNRRAREGRPPGEEEARASSDRRSGCNWLRWVFNWATKWRTPQGHYLLRENPVRGFDAPSEANPRRPVATTERYRALRAVSDRHTMESRWDGKRKARRSYLSELLDIAALTGRRISAICQLRFQDLRLSDGGPHGSVRWPADTDKMGRETTVPIDSTVRAALDRILRERPGIGEAPLFPQPGKLPGKPMSRHLADNWLREAEKLAGLAPQKGGAWHPFRRMWATARKGLPVQDVAAAGGWKSAKVVQDIYQRPDFKTMLNVVLGGGEVKEAQG